jgi:hypothetical protein
LTKDCLRAFEGESRPDWHDSFLSFQTNISLEFIRNCQGAIALSNCTIDVRLLSEVLRGDSKVAELVLAPQTLNDANTSRFVDALKTNKCLTEISLVSNPLGDEHWIRIGQSIAQHPKLQR